MARPVKDGLDYFPKDTGFYHDPKIRALIGRFGSDGAVLYDYLLCEAYGRNGYYAEMNDLFVDIIAADLGMSPEKIGLILDYLLNKSMLLDGTLFKAVKVLTSHGIQTRYQEAVRGRAKNRGIDVDGKLWLLNEAETESFIKVRQNENKSGINCDKSGINCDKSEKNFLNKNESKVNKSESKVKESKVEANASCPEPETGSSPLVYTLPLNDGTDYLIFQNQVQEWSALYPAVDVMQQLRNMKGWLSANPERRKTKKGILRFVINWLSKEQNRGGVSRPAYKSGGQGNELLEMIERGEFGD